MFRRSRTRHAPGAAADGDDARADTGCSHRHGGRGAAGARAQPSAAGAAAECRPVTGRRNHGGAEAEPGPDLDQRELSRLCAERLVQFETISPTTRTSSNRSATSSSAAANARSGRSSPAIRRTSRRKTASDAERQLIFQTAQAFINVLLAKSTLELAQENLKNFSNVVDVNRERVRAGDLAEVGFLQDFAPEAAVRTGSSPRPRSRSCWRRRRCGRTSASRDWRRASRSTATSPSPDTRSHSTN